MQKRADALNDSARVSAGEKDELPVPKQVAKSPTYSAIMGTLKSLGVSSSSDNPQDTKALMDSLSAPTSYADSVGRVRGYSIPKQFCAVLLQSPHFSLAWKDAEMFSFKLGLARTEHDPKKTSTTKYYFEIVGPDISSAPDERNIGFLKSQRRNGREYPISFPPMYDAGDITSWASYHIISPKGARPYLGISAVQNELAAPTDFLYDEIRILHKSANAKWRQHYDQILSREKDKAKGAPIQAFGYPNRSAILAALGLAYAKKAGYDVVAVEGGAEPRPIYIQVNDFLQRCLKGATILFVDELSPRTVGKKLHGF